MSRRALLVLAVGMQGAGFALYGFLMSRLYTEVNWLFLLLGWLVSASLVLLSLSFWHSDRPARPRGRGRAWGSALDRFRRLIRLSRFAELDSLADCVGDRNFAVSSYSHHQSRPTRTRAAPWGVVSSIHVRDYCRSSCRAASVRSVHFPFDK